MDGRIVLVTGATGGLGGAIVNAFRNQGDTVIAVARSGADFAADLTDPAQAGQAVQRTLDLHGRIDVLVHALGGFSAGGGVAETPLETWEKMMDLNLLAAVYILKAVIPNMVRAGRGRIVAVGSRTGVEPASGLSAYGVSKAALNALIRTVALELKDHGITANVVLPGTIRTSANLAWGTPEQAATWVDPSSIAGLIAWLASDAAADVSGALVPVYGRS